MSRIPRSQEFLKNGFMAEAASAAKLRAFLEAAPLDTCEYINTLVCQECATRMEEFGYERQEYIILALHALNECLGRHG